MILSSRQADRTVREDVTGNVTNVKTSESMEGAPTLTLDLNDPSWIITNSAVLDKKDDGRLDHVETQYRDAWWRLVEVSPRNEDLSLTFENRVVSVLRSYRKPKKHRRVSGYTRAMFLKALVDEANADGHKIEFVCPRLHDEQTIKKNKVPRPHKDKTGAKGFSKGDLRGRKKHGHKGRRISPSDEHHHPGDIHVIPPKVVVEYKLTIRGAKPSKEQVKNIEKVLGTADQLNAPRRATVALMEACIDESNCRNLQGGDADSGGILQVRRSVHPTVNVRDIEQCVTLFLTKGFSGRGGAITLANTTTLPPHMIAQDVQGSATADGSNYKAFQGEADAWVNAYHVLPDGSNSETVTYAADNAYFFGRGYDSGGGTIKDEDSWTAMTRLASEVNWRVFVRGNTVYYLSDDDLYKQKPRVEFNRLKGTVIDASFDWDEGKPVNELDLTVQRQDIPHGVTIGMEDAGPASGRWLVWGIETEATGGFSNLTCRTPQKAKSEPAPSQTTTTGKPQGASQHKEDTFKTLLRACKSITDHTGNYLYGGSHGADLDKTPPSARFDCSSSVAWALRKAGLLDSRYAPVSGTFASSWGKPGRGKFFTVWANAEHVWIQFHKGPWWRFDTSQHSYVKQEPGHGHVVRYVDAAALVKTSRSTAGFTPRHWEGL